MVTILRLLPLARILYWWQTMLNMDWQERRIINNTKWKVYCWVFTLSFGTYIKEFHLSACSTIITELKQPRRRRQPKPHKFTYLTMKNSIFARFARAFFIFWHFQDVLVLSTTWNDLFCTCVDDVSRWWQMFNFVCLCHKRWFQFNSRIVRTHF